MNEFKIVGSGHVVLQCYHPDAEWEDGFDQVTREKIDKAWTKAVNASNGQLFDGSLFNCTSVEASASQIVVKGAFISYKFFWAQRNIPQNLHITPVGVSGVLLIENTRSKYFVFAKRTNSNLQYADYYELVPSGGINKTEPATFEINYYDQLMIELKEEVGIDKNHITEVKSMGLIFDKRDKVFDIACLIKTTADKNKLSMIMKCSNEYRDLELVEADKLNEFVEVNKDNIVPASLGLIEMFNQLK